MKKLITLLAFVLFAFENGYAQTEFPKSEGYLFIQMINVSGKPSIINISSPAGESRQVECYKVPMAFGLSEVVTESISKNLSKLLEVLETYRKDGYELVSVSNEYSGSITNYLLLKK